MVGRHISDEAKEMALSMSLQGLSDAEVRGLTGISERSLKRLRSTYRNTGAVSRPSPGQNRTLTSMEVKACCTMILSFELDVRLTVSCYQLLCDCVDRRSDIALKELQVELQEVFKTETSVQTIARALQTAGYGMKTVRRISLDQLDNHLNPIHRSRGPFWNETSKSVWSFRPSSIHSSARSS